jgi:hypothetical protein
MAKGQKRSNREKKKPKASVKKVIAAQPTRSATAMTLTAPGAGAKRAR